jgi:TonB family protein
MSKNVINESTDNDLTWLLRLWLIPGAPPALDRRLARSFHWLTDYQLGIASPRVSPCSTTKNTEVTMKRCNACDEEIADKFSFCPVDGTPLNDLAAAVMGQNPEADHDCFALKEQAINGAKNDQFNLTIISEIGLTRRLASEVSFLATRLVLAWPDFKRDPLAFSLHALNTLTAWLRRTLLAPDALAGGLTAMLLVLTAVVALLLFGRASKPVGDSVAELDEPVQIIDLRPLTKDVPFEGNGVGANGKGRVGFASGKGEGARPELRQSRGGGGSGDHDRKPVQQGTVAQPSEIPAPINPPLPNPALPQAGIDIDPALWKSMPAAVFGDPRSKSTVASKGSGDGGGVGNGNGLGNGDGDGNGVGPGKNGNMGGGEKDPGGGGPSGAPGGNDPRDRNFVFPPSQVSQRPRVLAKPEAGYTEEARKSATTGTVVLRAIFSDSGEVTGIRAVKSLPFGLTERAIAAARRIRFVPAVKDGHPVSVYMQLEYVFNLY